MAKMIQIRHVPDDVHATLKARAAAAGMNLSDYLRDEVTRLARRPTMEAWLDGLRGDEPVLGGPSTPELLDEIRGE
jgi:hypothetical protein